MIIGVTVKVHGMSCFACPIATEMTDTCEDLRLKKKLRRSYALNFPHLTDGSTSVQPNIDMMVVL